MSIDSSSFGRQPLEHDSTANLINDSLAADVFTPGQPRSDKDTGNTNDSKGKDSASFSFDDFSLPSLDWFGSDDRPKEKEPLELKKHENKAFNAYMEALGEAGAKGYGEKFTVVMFTQENCGFCDRNKNMLAKHGAEYGDKAVFSVSNPTKDNGGKQLFDAADGTAYPMTVVFATSRDRIHIVGQAVGELDDKQMKQFLADSMRKPMADYNKDTSDRSAAAMV